MRVLDPGHTYQLKILDGNLGDFETLCHVKRIGTNYPGNIAPAYPGTTTQEVLRAEIDRLRYVNTKYHV